MSEFPVSRNTDNTFNVQKIPIIFVPGVMGTRLNFPDSPFTPWDPDSIGFPVTWPFLLTGIKRSILNFSKSAQVFLRALPLGQVTPVITNIPITFEEETRGWGGPVNSFYASFLRFMSNPPLANPIFNIGKFFPFETPVYAVGYDWRQSNGTKDPGDSGTFVAGKIREILKRENAEKMILISHSMGGLVTRSVLKANKDLSDKVVGILHVMQPVVGATVFYRRTYSGNQIPEDGTGVPGFLLNEVLGTTGVDFVEMVCGLRGPTELMPTANYKDGGNGQWINFFSGPFIKQSLGVRESDFFPYNALSHPPGLVNLNVTDDSGIEMKARVDEAQAFHKKLGLFKHDNTFSIFSTGAQTDVTCFLTQDDRVDFPQCRRREGDGTVPASSASILFPNQTKNTLADICNGDTRQFVVKGVQHSAGMGDPAVQALAEAIVRKMLGIQCFGPLPTLLTPGDKTSDRTFEQITDDQIAGKKLEESGFA